MSFENIKIFIFGFLCGVVVLIFLIWFLKNSVSKNISFFGVTTISEIVEIKKDLKLYQDGKEIGKLFKGTKLEKTLNVDKIDHYSLNIIFEPFSYENVKEILDENKNIEDFSVTDMIYMDDNSSTTKE